MTDIHLRMTGLDREIEFIGTVKEFRKIARRPLREAGKELAADEKRLMISRKSKPAVLSVRNAPGGLRMKIGPKYKDNDRPGYLAALFQETGTGVHGPKGRPFGAKYRKGRRASGHASAVSFSVQGDRLARYSVKGMKPHPWFDEANRMARQKLPAALSAGLAKAIKEARG